jgi:hypothetical protein
MVWPRWLARLKAWTFGYFWLPCPLCKRSFAGFEWGESVPHFTKKGTGVGVCSRPRCIEAARMREQLDDDRWEYQGVVWWRTPPSEDKWPNAVPAHADSVRPEDWTRIQPPVG